jgi:hypothetical protein
VLEPDAWAEVRLIHESVLKLAVEVNGTSYTYRDICARWILYRFVQFASNFGGGPICLLGPVLV